MILLNPEFVFITNAFAKFLDEVVVERRRIIPAFEDGKPPAVLSSLVVFPRLDEKGPLAISRPGDPSLNKLFLLLEGRNVSDSQWTDSRGRGRLGKSMLYSYAGYCIGARSSIVVESCRV